MTIVLLKFLKRALLKDVPEGSLVKLTPQGRLYTVGKNVPPSIELHYNGKTSLHGEYVSVYVCRPTTPAPDQPSAGG